MLNFQFQFWSLADKKFNFSVKVPVSLMQNKMKYRHNPALLKTEWNMVATLCQLQEHKRNRNVRPKGYNFPHFQDWLSLRSFDFQNILKHVSNADFYVKFSTLWSYACKLVYYGESLNTKNSWNPKIEFIVGPYLHGAHSKPCFCWQETVIHLQYIKNRLYKINSFLAHESIFLIGYLCLIFFHQLSQKM